MSPETHNWLRTLVPVVIMGLVFYIGQRESLAVLVQKVDVLTEVLQETNQRMEGISNKVIANDKEVSLQIYAIKGLDERMKRLEERAYSPLVMK